MASEEAQSGVVVAQRQPPQVDRVAPGPVVDQVAPVSAVDPDKLDQEIAQRPSPSPDHHSHHRAARAVAVSSFLVALVAIGLVLLNPETNPTSALVDRVSAWLESRNAPQWIAEEQTVERLANVVLFVPFGLVGMLAWRRRGVLWWGGAGFLVSLAAEIAQYRFLPGRTASAEDVVSNTAGAFTGALLAASLLAVTYLVLALVRMVRRSAARRRLRFA